MTLRALAVVSAFAAAAAADAAVGSNLAAAIAAASLAAASMAKEGWGRREGKVEKKDNEEKREAVLQIDRKARSPTSLEDEKRRNRGPKEAAVL